MAHRVNFNVYRYGKTVNWNFSPAGTNIHWSLRAGHLMNNWVIRVLKNKHIRVVRAFSRLSGEFPAIKIIGYREVYFRYRARRRSPVSYRTVLASRKILRAADFLPVPTGVAKTGWKVTSYRRRAWRNTKLRSTYLARRGDLERAAYRKDRFPILRANFRAGQDVTSQLRQLMFFERLIDSELLFDGRNSLDGGPARRPPEASSYEDVLIGTLIDPVGAEAVLNWNIDLDYIFNVITCQRVFSSTPGPKTAQRRKRSQKLAVLERRKHFEQASFFSVVKEKIDQTRSNGAFNFIAAHLWAIKFIRTYKDLDCSRSGGSLPSSYSHVVTQLVKLDLSRGLAAIFQKFCRLHFVRSMGNLGASKRAERDYNPFWAPRLFLLQMAGLFESMRPKKKSVSRGRHLLGINKVRLLVYFYLEVASRCSRRLRIKLKGRGRRNKIMAHILGKLSGALGLEKLLGSPFMFLVETAARGKTGKLLTRMLVNSKDELESERIKFAKFFARFLAKYSGLNARMENEYSKIMRKAVRSVKKKKALKPLESFFREAYPVVKWSTTRAANSHFANAFYWRAKTLSSSSLRSLFLDYASEEWNAVEKWPFLYPSDENPMEFWRAGLRPWRYTRPIPLAHDIADTLALNAPAFQKKIPYMSVYKNADTGSLVYVSRTEARQSKQYWSDIIKNLNPLIKAARFSLNASKQNKLAAAQVTSSSGGGFLVNGRYFSQFLAFNIFVGLRRAIDQVIFGKNAFDGRGRYMGVYTTGLFDRPERLIKFIKVINQLWRMAVERAVSSRDIINVIKNHHESVLALTHPLPHLSSGIFMIFKYPFVSPYEVTYGLPQERVLNIFEDGAKKFFYFYSRFNSVITSFAPGDLYLKKRGISARRAFFEKLSGEVVLVPSRQKADNALDFNLAARLSKGDNFENSFFSATSLYVYSSLEKKYKLYYQRITFARLIGSVLARRLFKLPIPRSHYAPHRRGLFHSSSGLSPISSRINIIIRALIRFSKSSYCADIRRENAEFINNFFSAHPSSRPFRRQLSKALSSAKTRGSPLVQFFGIGAGYHIANDLMGRFLMVGLYTNSHWGSFLDFLKEVPENREIAKVLSLNTVGAEAARLDDPQLVGGFYHDYSRAGALVNLNSGLEENVKSRKRLAVHLESKALLLNLSSGFYKIFGIYYNIFYYPVTKVFESSPRMQELASRGASFLRNYVSRDPKFFLWLSEFLIIYYICIYLRITEPLVYFMTKVFSWEFRWNIPWYYMWTVIRSVNLHEFGISSIRFGFHGKYSGKERAFRLYRIWGVNPCLRNAHLTGSYSFRQIKSKYGTSHLHVWMTLI